MRLKIFSTILVMVMTTVPSSVQPILNQQNESSKTLVDRADTTGFIQLEAESFKSLSPREKELAYWLTQASIAIDPIIYDQLSRVGLRQKRLLEEMVACSQGIKPLVKEKITAYAKLFWANRGNHNETTGQKFLPAFTFEQLQQAAAAALKHRAMQGAYALPAIRTQADLTKELQELKPAFFDPEFEPIITAKSPQGGRDILQSSSNNFYVNVSLADLKGFTEKFPLNSRLVNSGGHLLEEVYRAGAPDAKVKPGRYATFLRRANQYLEKAAAVAEPPQARAIRDLVRYYQTGDFQDWLKFDADWVQNNASVDFANGFIEVYRDARGAKGSSQSFVSITDKPVTETMMKLAQNAEYFEQKAPWEAKYKKQSFKPPVVKAVETLIETGDFHVTTVGDNLPNENEIHEKYGTKNFLFTGSSRALFAASGIATLEEFASSPEEVELGKKYGIEAADLMTALHEVIGHGSGKLSPRLTRGAEPYLKEYFSTLEEARADLMALWNAWDPKLKDLGLVSDQENVAKTMYNSAAQAPLTQLRRIPRGDTIEEDHQRDRQLIVNYIIDKTGAIERIERDGKTYMQVKDYQEMHRGVSILLAELMRIKAEGDYDAVKALVEKYAVHFDPALRDQVVTRYQKLNLPTYWAGINAQLTAKKAANGKMSSVEISYPRDALRQYLGYAAMYNPALSPVQKRTLGSSSRARIF